MFKEHLKKIIYVEYINIQKYKASIQRMFHKNYAKNYLICLGNLGKNGKIMNHCSLIFT